MVTVTETDTGGRGNGKPTELPVEELKDAFRGLGQALMVRTLQKAGGQVEGLTQRLNDAVDDGGGTGAKMAATGAKKIVQGDSPLKAGVGAGLTGAKEKVKKAVGAGICTLKSLKISMNFGTMNTTRPVTIKNATIKTSTG